MVAGRGRSKDDGKKIRVAELEIRVADLKSRMADLESRMADFFSQSLEGIGLF